MTEKYKIVGDADIYEGFIAEGNICDYLELEDVLHLLNKLAEENERLKRQICNLEHTRDFCAECCERLEKENEQLKSEIRGVRGAYEQLWMRL